MRKRLRSLPKVWPSVASMAVAVFHARADTVRTAWASKTCTREARVKHLKHPGACLQCAHARPRVTCCWRAASGAAQNGSRSTNG
jgi:hypothetical protein